MYHTCLHCTRDLGTNDSVETLPIGRRIAFDAAKGRLWVVCRSCGKWNLVPFDNRLEAIDDCARLFHDTKTRFSTENIGLARMPDGLDLVRIGEPQRPEFASWRYGAQYKRRRAKTISIGVIGGVASMAAAAVLETTALNAGIGVAFGFVGLYVPTFGWQAIQTRRHSILAKLPGRTAPARLHDTAWGSIHLTLDRGNVQIGLYTGLVDALRKRVTTVDGPDARWLLRRILGSLNRRAGSSKHLSRAISLMESTDVEGWVRQLGRSSVDLQAIPASKRWRHTLVGNETPAHYPGFGEGLRVAALPAGDRLAIEMWLSEEDEARALAGELALLERHWKEAEELAAIADGLSLGSGDPSS